MSSEDEHIATLVLPDEYVGNANQVAEVSTNKLVLIKRKELALKPFELVQYPMAECSAITYEIKWAIMPMIFGALLVALILFTLTLDIPAGTSLPIGALGAALIAGAVWLRGPKRHRLTFVMNGKRLRWQSKAGEFKAKLASTQRVIAFAREKGLLSPGSPTAESRT